ncbi:MAG: hypothetical protein JW709_08735 [Sedimentisphaerales bacterium]|nr:hypothetical protein [Sedimentisphaerales bacterium]
MKKTAFLNVVLSSLAIIVMWVLPSAGMETSELEKNFLSPPDSARPWVYWFWINGNITREGITADLEAMARVGVGGVLIMEVTEGVPVCPVEFAGPEWRELFQHVLHEADRLGLEVNMNNDAGWCGSGGPWITPELSMQKIVWTETTAQGGKRFDAVLEQPETQYDYYRDIVVQAFHTPKNPAKVENLVIKAAYGSQMKALYVPAQWPDEEGCIPCGDIMDISDKMDASGHLQWDVPEGQWTILRLGHTTTGQNNHPAPATGRGLECDKLSKEAAEVHFAGLIGKLIEDAGPDLTGKVLAATHVDSWEVGSQNWSPKFRNEFQKRRGYDLLDYMPIMAGWMIDNRTVSERFLWDIRLTVSELVRENYAGHFAQMAHRHGMRFTTEGYHTLPSNDIAYAGRTDEPMGEFWQWWWMTSGFDISYSCIEMTSAAHVYGKRIVGAEAFTSIDTERWLSYPGSIKPLGDWAFCQGINRFVFHRYAMQPWLNVKPGMSMGPWGLHYERTQTWWEMSKAWHTYLARCQQMLRQGLFVADVCYLMPEGMPQSLAYQNSFLETPGYIYTLRERRGYNFDVCPAEALMTRMSVKDGRLVLPDGMSYRLLVLPASETITPELLNKVKELVEAGATVAGSRPVASPSLSDYPQCDVEVKKLAEKLFGQGDAPADITARKLGKGCIYWGQAFEKKFQLNRDTQQWLADAQWIWYPEGNPAQAVAPGECYFQRTITIDGECTCEKAQLIMAADNSFTCWINGEVVAAGSDFKRPVNVDITTLLKPGENLLTVTAENGGNGPNPAALIGTIVLQYEDGQTKTITTDNQWLASKEKDAKDPWRAALEIGDLGMAPWGDIKRDVNDYDVDLYPEENLVAAIMQKMGVAPDVRFQTKSGAPSLRYIHRSVDGTEVYFVANRLEQPEVALCSFRVSGKQPELWRPMDGRIEQTVMYEEANGMTHLPIAFESADSVFVVFRDKAAPASERIVSVSHDGQLLLSTRWNADDVKPASLDNPHPVNIPAANLTSGRDNQLHLEANRPGNYILKTTNGQTMSYNIKTAPEAVAVEGPWQVHFTPGWGAPESITLDRLMSWTYHEDAGVRYYSGTAAYHNTFDFPETWVKENRRVYLDLGQVFVMAEVKVNGRDLGVLWKSPYRVDITQALQAGRNTLEIDVANLWVNRMIGDAQLLDDPLRRPNGTMRQWPQWLLEGKSSPPGKYTFTTWELWPKEATLLDSGLLGPVQLISSVTAPFRTPGKGI